MKLTGKTRMRVHQGWFGEPMLVIQVQETWLHSESLGGVIDVEHRTRWRDAKVTDIKTECSLTEQKS